VHQFIEFVRLAVAVERDSRDVAVLNRATSFDLVGVRNTALKGLNASLFSAVYTQPLADGSTLISIAPRTSARPCPAGSTTPPGAF
jgi:hypothetical protein